MFQAPNIDGVLITWCDRLFYPGNRVVKVKSQPKLNGGSAHQRVVAIRERIAVAVVRGAPQVMVKVTGGGRGMKAISAHFRYISKSGRLAWVSRADALETWMQLGLALAATGDAADRSLARSIERFVHDMPYSRSTAYPNKVHQDMEPRR
jgi:hypothetical protein